jgi:CHAT domain-containing protein
MRPPGSTVRAIMILVLATLACSARAAHAQSPPPSDRVTRDSLVAAGMVARGHADSTAGVLMNLIATTRASRDHGQLVRALRMRGSALANTGAGAAALVPLDEAARLAAGIRDTLTLLRVMRWQAYALGEQGRFAEQQATGERMLTLAHLVHDRTHEGHALHTLGWVALRAGRFPEARALLERSVTTFAALHDAGNESFVRATYGSALLSLGLYDEARANYAQVITIARQLHLPWVEARALNDLGEIESEFGDLGAAAQHFDEAYQTHAKGGQWQEAMLELTNRIGTEVQLGRYDDALAHGREGLAVCDAHALRFARGWILQAMAEAEEAQGHRREQGRLLHAVLALGDTLPPQTRVTAMLHEAQRLASCDSMVAAVAITRDVLSRDVGSLSVAVANYVRGVAAGIFLDAGQPAEAMAQANLSLAIPGADASPVRVADARWMQARALMRMGHVAQARATYAQAISAWESRRQATNDAEFRETLGGELAPSLATGAALATLDPRGAEGDTASAAVHVARAYALAQRLRTRTLLERMRGPRAAPGDSLAVAPLDLASLQARVLRPGELLLEMYASRDTCLVFVVTREHASWYTLPGTRHLAAPVQLTNDLLAHEAGDSGEQDAARAAIATLATRLLTPAATAIGVARTVILAPDGVLHAAPFEAMVAALAHGGAARTVVRVPSATVLEQVRAHRASAGTQGIFAFAGPPAGGVTLTGAAREVRALGDAYEGVTVRDAVRDTTRWSVTDLARYQVLHLAAHTHLDPQRPWRSGLEVGGGLLTASAIAQQPLTASLVVLTSCRSADGRALAGEGVAGLTNAFLAAGAPAVVAALWPVDDQATARFTEGFYAALAHGATASEALEAARSRVAADPATSAPFHWAAWVLIGDGDVKVAMRAKPFSLEHLGLYLVVLLALLTALAAVGGIRSQKKNHPRV